MKAFNISLFRTIKTSLTRFLSIILISFLGSAIFAGLFAVPPNMETVTNEYFNKYNTMDIKMISTFGFNDEDIVAIRNTSEVKNVMASYSIDIAGSVNERIHTFRINSLPNDLESNDYINQLKLVSGSFPTKSSETIIIRPATGFTENITIGSSVILNNKSNPMTENFIDNYEYKIVGIAESPAHLSFMQGNTTLGTGIIEYIMYVPSAAFISEYYTNVYVKLNNLENLNIFSKEYKTYVAKTIKEELQLVATTRERLIFDNITLELTNALEVLDLGQAQLDLALSQLETQNGLNYEQVATITPVFNQYYDDGKTLDELAIARDRFVIGSDDYIAYETLYQLLLAFGIPTNVSLNLINELTVLKEQFNDLINNKQLLTAGYLTYNEGVANLATMQNPKWFILDNELDESFKMYKDNIGKMRDLGSLFPIVFFLVAALVSLTTMARMVDEDRTLIGTFKSLGYSNTKIVFKYLNYAILASFIGSFLGALVGFYVIPKVIWGAFGIIFTLPTFVAPFYLKYLLISVVTTSLIIGLATYFSVHSLLKVNPAQLMRPKPPKVGKKVLLERIDPIWKRLSFLQKITIRNLSLNLKRLILTFIGIVGSTALVVTAFGAREAIASVIDDQFKEIYLYDTVVTFTNNDLVDAQMQDEKYFMGDSGLSFYSYAKSGSTGSKIKDDFDVFIVSPDNAKNLSSYVALRDTKTNEVYELTDDSVVITEKLAQNLKVKVGDEITISYMTDDAKYRVKVTSITANFTLNYVYIGKDAYLHHFNKMPEYNQYYGIKNKDIDKKVLSDDISAIKGVSTVSYIDDMLGNIETSIKSVNIIILILMVSAGLLAFVVLYNLANINIGERYREIATFKVLGFYPKETNQFIFREITLLNIISILSGLVVGLFLYRQVILTIEPPMLYLAKNLSWFTYVGSFVMTFAFGLIANQAIKPKVNKIDMLESLKSTE